MKVGVSGNTQQTYKGLQLLVSMGYDIAFIFGLPDEQLDGKVNSINLSWMPSFVIYRLFHIYCRSLIPGFYYFNLKKNYTKIYYNHYSKYDKIIDKLIFSYLKFKL